MSRRDDLDPALDAQLGELLRDAVAGVDPDDRLGELRAQVSRPSRRRPALVVLAGSALAGAAAVAAVAVGPQLVGSDDDPDEPPAAGSASDDASDPASTAVEPSDRPVATRDVPVFYLGDTPAGPRLYREVQQTGAPDDGPGASLDLLTSPPVDPDYRTVWPADAFAGGTVEGDRVTVDLTGSDLLDRPAGVDPDEAQASVQQVVYTMQAYAQAELPVEFRVSGSPVDRVLGVPASEPVDAQPVLDTLSLVSLETPTEGETVSGQLAVTGAANSFEGTVPWSLEQAGAQVDQGFFTAEGSMGTTLFSFRGSIDVSSLPPGTYSLVVQTGDPSGGTEGPGAFSDSRTVVVE